MNEGAEVTEKSTPRRHEDTEAMAGFVSVTPRLRDVPCSVRSACSVPRSFPRGAPRSQRVGPLPTANSQSSGPAESVSTHVSEFPSLGVGNWELEVGRWELGVGRWRLTVGVLTVGEATHR